MPTSPTIAETIGQFGLWIIFGIVIIAFMVFKFKKPADDLPIRKSDSLPWQRTSRK